MQNMVYAIAGMLPVLMIVGMVVGVLVIAEQGVGAVKEPVALPEKEPAVSLEKKQSSD